LKQPSAILQTVHKVTKTTDLQVLEVISSSAMAQEPPSDLLREAEAQRALAELFPHLKLDALRAIQELFPLQPQAQPPAPQVH
jgi:hypothetical protein